MGNHVRGNKKSRLIEMLAKVDKRRHYKLYINTCYFTPNAAKSIIMSLKDEVSIEEVNINIDRREAIKWGRNSLEDFCQSFRLFPVYINAVETPTLFHSKTYSLVNLDKDGYITSGSLVIGSANLTGMGVSLRSGNIESFINTQDLEIVADHYNQMQKLNLIDLYSVNKFSKNEEYSFKYALINEGYFYHKWSENLGQYLAVRFKLSEEGKKQIKNETLEGIGFKIDTATISKQYFFFDNILPTHFENTSNLFRDYGIETHLGYWVPKCISNSIDAEEFEQFSEKLFGKLESEIVTIKNQIISDFDFLLSKGLIEIVEDNESNENSNIAVSNFNKKVEKLKTNPLKLKRIFSKYDIFELPYEITDKENIEELFAEMLEVVESKSRKNSSCRAFIISYKKLNLEPIQQLNYSQSEE
jgi:hypothetical protein